MGLLNFQQTEKLLLKYKIPFCRTKLTQSKREALIFAEKIGYPVVLKISSPDILHKTDVGGVKTGIRDGEGLKKAFDRLIKIKGVEGILVQKTVKGTALALGMKRDPQFGPVLMTGLGGIFIEVLKDVAFRIAPVSEKEGLAMLKELKSYPVLQGCRRIPPANVKEICKVIANLSELSLKEKEIKEIDLNPIIINEKKALVVDAKIVI